MVKINSRARSMVILNSSDLCLNSVIDKLISAKKKECSISMDKRITFVELIQLSKNHVDEITPLVCQVLFERNDDSGINLRRCDSTLCFINKLCSNTFVSLPTTTDILFSNQHHETSNTRKGEESHLNVPEKVEPKNEEYLSKDAEAHDLSNKTVNISQCKNVIKGQLTSGIAPTDLRASIYKGHQQQNNPIYKKKEKINEENNERKLSQKKKGSQANNKMCETFHLTNGKDTNSDAISVKFSGGSSLQSNKSSSTTTAKGKENLSPSLFKSITVSKSLLNIPNHVNKSRGNDCDETASVNVDVENVVTRDHGAGFKFTTDEKKNSPRCSEGNQMLKKDESFTGYITSSAKFRDLIPSDIAPPNHNSLSIQISNENISFFDSLSNYGPSHDSTTTNENYSLTPFEDNLIRSQKLGGDSSRSESTSLDIDSRNQNICNKLENLVQELRKVVVYSRGCCLPPVSNLSKHKPQNLTMIQTNKNFHIEELLPKFRRTSSDNGEPTFPNLSKCCGTDSVQFTKNIKKSLSGFFFKELQALPKKPSKIPLKKKSSLYFGKRCFFKHQPAHKRKNAASYCSFPCDGTFCCFRHISKPNCNCCNKCVFLKQTRGKGTNNKEHNLNVNSDTARQASQTFEMKDGNKKFLLFSSNDTLKETFHQTCANSNAKQTSTKFTHTEMIHTKVSTENNSNLHIIASKSSIKPKSLICKKCSSKNIRKTHPVGASKGVNSDCITVSVCCNDTVSLQTTIRGSQESIESYIDAKAMNLLSGSKGNRMKRCLKNNHRCNIITNHSRKLNNLESAHILSQFPNKPKSKKYHSKLMNRLIKKENCSGHSIKCKNNCEEKKAVDNVSISRQKKKIMEDVVGGVELVLYSIKELKKIVYDENF